MTVSAGPGMIVGAGPGAWLAADRGSRRRDAIAVGLPAALAVGLCLVQIADRSIGFDEAATVTIAAQHGSALGSAIAHDGGNMSGYYLLLHVLIAAFGDGELVIRLPSAIASISTVALVGTVGLRMFGRRAAFASGLLTAVSLPLVFWAQNARGYALMVAFVCAAFLTLVSIVGPAARRGRRSPRPVAWIAYVAFMTLATYSSFVAVLVIPAQLLVLLPRGRRARLRQFAIALGAIAVLCVPLLVLAVRRGSGQLFWVPRPTMKIDLQVLQSLTSAGLQPSFHRTPTASVLMVVTAGLALVIALALAWGQGEPAWGAAVAVAWIVVPVVIASGYSLVAQPVFLPRNLLMGVPAVGLLLGAGIADPRLPRALAPAALVALVALRALQLLPTYGVSPEPWQQATGYVVARARPHDCVAFYPMDGRMAFQYYVGAGAAADRRAPRSVLPVARWGEVRPYVEDYASLSRPEITRLVPDCARLWLVSSHEGQANGPAQSRANRMRFLDLRAGLERRYEAGESTQLGYAATIHVLLLVGHGVRPARQR